jgi:hypothetical protein
MMHDAEQKPQPLKAYARESMAAKQEVLLLSATYNYPAKPAFYAAIGGQQEQKCSGEGARRP